MRLPWPDLGAAADLAACRALLRGGSRSFHAASLVLPRRVREPATALYAFCRLADDAIDLENGRGHALARLRERLARAYDGRPLPVPADRAFAAVVRRFGIPRALPEALLDGFAWDADGRRCADLAALHAYAARVAGSVGAMMALLMGARGEMALARACDLGVAMQLSNVARDVGEDARAGRLYLPLDWMREAGIDPDAWLAAPVFDVALGSVVARVLDEAERLYARASVGVGLLPLACRPGIGAARRLYAEIGREVARGGFDSVSRRAVVPSHRKAWLLALAVGDTICRRAGRCDPPLAETGFLVEAAFAARLPARQAAAWWDVGEQIAWIVELFHRLEMREHMGGTAP